tara:strand:- start:11549 stop:12373 length:825 start_codon:yes stop_codon:yes gene_type:complete
MSISAKEVQELRKMSGAGMMECKSALNDSNGDVKEAFKLLREKGIAKAEKKSGREANEGLIGIKNTKEGASIIEINSETDFVSRNKEFQELVYKILDISMDHRGDNKLLENCKDLISDAVGKIGENIVFKRAGYIDGNIHTYIHNKIDDGLGKIGVLLKLSRSEKELSDVGKKLCMHIAAASPLSISEKDLDNKYLEAEKEIIEKQLKDSGKPANIVEKMLQGKVNKIFEEVTLLKQKFVMDQSLSIGDYLKDVSEEVGETITVDKFLRYELGN